MRLAQSPSPNGLNGRDTSGRFATGNPGGPGNPLGARCARFRTALLESVTDADLRAVARTLVRLAKKGEGWAVRELLDRAIGKPQETDLLARLEALEAAAQDMGR